MKGDLQPVERAEPLVEPRWHLDTIEQGLLVEILCKLKRLTIIYIEEKGESILEGRRRKEKVEKKTKKKKDKERRRRKRRRIRKRSRSKICRRGRRSIASKKKGRRRRRTQGKQHQFYFGENNSNRVDL